VTPPPAEEAPEQPPEEQPPVGEEILPLFGHDIFVTAEEQPLLPSIAPPAPTYVLGPGDEVELRVWGRGIEYVNVVQVVSNDGGIYGQSVGRIPVAGKTIAEARDGILALYRKLFPECDVSLSVSMLRSIEVMVVGDVARPGRKTLPGTATVFTALYAAGGPLESGSLRAIDVRRGTELAASVDLYDYLLRGDTSRDITLQAGDTVFVHVIGPVVAIKGEVRRQARYEIRQGATLAEVLDMSGGIRGSAYAQRIQVQRPEQNRERMVVEADLVDEPEKWRGVELSDGDEVVVLPVLEELRNAITVEGAVRRPDAFAWSEGLTVTDVIERAEGPLPEALRDAVHVLRESPQGMRDVIKVNLIDIAAGRAPNVPLQPRDIVHVFAIPEVEPNVLYVEGAVMLPGEKEFHRGMTVADLVRAAGGLTADAYGEAATLVRKNASFEDTYLAVPIGKIMSGLTNLDVPLQNRDKLVVALQAEKGREKLAVVAGAVARPDKYPIGAGTRLSDLIGMAGGLLPEATGEVSLIRGQTADAAQVETVDVSALKAGDVPANDPLLREGDTVSVNSVGGFHIDAQFAQVRGQVAHPGAFPLLRPDGKKLRLSDLVGLGGGLLPAAYPEMAAVYHTEESLLDRRRRVATVKAALQESATIAPDEEDESLATIYNPQSAEPAMPRVVRDRLEQVLSGGKGEAYLVVAPRALVDIRISTGVPVDLGSALRDPGGQADIQLQSGDVLVVFQRPDTVVVDGAVAGPGPQPFVQGATIRDYLWEAGRLTRDAELKHTVVVHYNGRASRAQLNSPACPGDWIIVPANYTVQKVSSAARATWFEQMTQAPSLYLLFRKI